MTSNGSQHTRWGRVLLILGGLGALVGFGSVIGFYWIFLRDLPDLQNVRDYQPSLSSAVFDREGRPIGEFFTERRKLVSFDQAPKHLVDAFVSAEDTAFFEHQGIDYPGILRAAWVNLRAGGEIRQGGSTITQQMVKSLLLSPERNYTRKIREMILARRIEQRFTKQEILYLYLNQIYFGHGAYGVAQAARSYFDKDVTELTVSEGAQLAGLPKAPSRYAPQRNPKAAEERRVYVLDRMREDGAIDAATYQRAIAEEPVFVDDVRADVYADAAYFTEEVRRFLFEELGSEAVLRGGLRIETTMDLDLQRAAVASLKSGLEALDRRNGYRGPVRQVEVDAIPAEIEKVGVENGLVDDPDAAEAASAGEDPVVALPEVVEVVEIAEIIGDLADPEGVEAEEAADAEDADSWPETDEPLLGVVTAVNEKEQRALVSVAPGIEAVVLLADVSWARPMNPDIKPRPVEKIGAVLSVGDVARFVPLPPDENATGDDEEPAPVRLGLHQEPRVQGALLSIDVESDDVLAMVGGYDFTRSQFNRATQARRQPGSAFKPLIYGTALTARNEDGTRHYTPASIVHDRPKVYVDRRSGFVWKPKNYGRSFYGPITLRTALAKSVNNAAVHLCDEVGVDAVMDYAYRLGIRSPLERSLALALGTSDVSLLELTRTYAVFPARGRRVVPRFLNRVFDRDGILVLENAPLGDPLVEPPENDDVAAAGEPEGELEPSEALPEGALPGETGDPDRLLTEEDAYLIADMLRAVVLEGTGRRARVLARPIAGKTGTTNDQADAWFMGFSPEIATGVWVGFDESRFLGTGETGSRAALPIWTDYMRAALAGRPKRDFTLPESIVFARIDRHTGLLATRQSKDTVFQAFIGGTEPTETADAARSSSRALQDLREDTFAGDASLEMQLDF